MKRREEEKENNKKERKFKRSRRLMIISLALTFIVIISIAYYMIVIVTWVTIMVYPSVVLDAPSNNATINVNTTSFNWTGSGGNGTLWYVWYIDTDSTFTSPNLRTIDVNTSTTYIPAPLMDGDWYWRVEVTDNDSINVSSTFYLKVQTNLTNDFPFLTNTSVNPTVGNIYTTFYYNVTFNDDDNDSASYVYVYIDDVPYLMTETDALDINTSNGKNYTYFTTLGRGFHNYSFNCSDGVAVNSTILYHNPSVYGVVEQSDEIPENASTDIHIPPNNFSISVTEGNGSNMSIYLYKIDGGYTLFNQSIDVTNGTYVFTNTSWVTDLNTVYYWSVNATNGYSWSNETYHFTTITTYAPIILSYYPLNNSNLADVTNLNLTVTVFSHNSSLMNITWYSNYSGSWIEIGNDTNVGNGVQKQLAPVISYNERLYWRVNITDAEGLYTLSPIYNYGLVESEEIVGSGYWMLSVAMIFSVLPIVFLKRRRE